MIKPILRDRILTYKQIIKDLKEDLDNVDNDLLVLQLKILIKRYEVKLEWAVLDYKLALKKNGTI